jgi:hypothetical protein
VCIAGGGMWRRRAWSEKPATMVYSGVKKTLYL